MDVTYTDQKGPFKTSVILKDGKQVGKFRRLPAGYQLIMDEFIFESQLGGKKKFKTNCRFFGKLRELKKVVKEL